ncbi:hypothetical protein VHUM_01930 [Vanrija humicola]|uniref:VIT domain-containing protein n=1 Tax=Vanrija humicola TaxID=5417 RepID=A0A7D8Z4E3_VANHU|nr:hypothetical protein VHUM_01930 [Vanrija humicola]
MPYLPFCGCYTIITITESWGVRYEKRYLPIVGIDSHTRILATTSRTTLTQTFQNTNSTPLNEVQYTFPLYDGVTVVGFTFTVAGVTTRGVVKEREEAKAEYKAAVDRGETAGLLEQNLDAGDVFATSIGNVPAGETVTVKIEYLGVLQHDAQVDGIRLTIPTAVAPRYGQSDVYSTPAQLADEPFKVTVDAEVPAGSAIKSIQSPSHGIAVSIGTLSTAPDDEPSFTKASATLALKSTSLDKDFVIQVVASNLGEPSAVLETHPTIPNQRALMASLVPKFDLPSEAPELVFICDRSGSMGGKIDDLKSALRIFLKSLPVGVKFNICSFGSSFDFLWPKSQSYSAVTLQSATTYVDGFAANYGGTEMLQPVAATFKQRYTDINLEVFLLTDGEIWDQERLFKLINETVEESKGAVRVFTLGIGSGASSALVEGVARAGKGFSQSVADNEKMDKKVIRMLKASLLPQISDYTLEIKYDKPEIAVDGGDDFEIVDQTTIAAADQSKSKSTSPVKKAFSFFNKSQKDDDTIKVDLNAALPAITVPKYLQTPHEIPPLFPYNRTNVYVLLSDTTPTRTPSSVILRATSKHGPLELEIPIAVLDQKQETIHQLAARDAVHDLEEGRGWLTKAKDANGSSIKDKYPGRFDDLVKREAVRLGVTYQVGGKWCSFVAIRESPDGKTQAVGEAVEAHNDVAHNDPRAINTRMLNAPFFGAVPRGAAAVPQAQAAPSFGAGRTGAAAPSFGRTGAARTGAAGHAAAPLFGAARTGALPPPPPAAACPAPASAYAQTGMFGSSGASFGFSTSSGTAPAQFDQATVIRGYAGFGGGGSSAGFGGGGGSAGFGGPGLFGAAAPAAAAPSSLFGPSATAPGGLFGPKPTGSFGQASPATGSLFGQSATGSLFGQGNRNAFGEPAAASGGLFSSSKPAVAGGLSSFGATPGVGFGSSHQSGAPTLFGSPCSPAYSPTSPVSPCMAAANEDTVLAPPQVYVDPQVMAQYESERLCAESAPIQDEDEDEEDDEVALSTDILGTLIQLQAFEGNWSWRGTLERILGVPASQVGAQAAKVDTKYTKGGDITATAATIAYFKKKLADEHEVWELVVEKAKAWLAAKVGQATAKSLVAELEALI